MRRHDLTRHGEEVQKGDEKEDGDKERRRAGEGAEEKM